MAITPTWDSHQRRAIQPNGTVHAARYAGDRNHFTTACAVYPAPQVERLDGTPGLDVTCRGCLDVLLPAPDAHLDA